MVSPGVTHRYRGIPLDSSLHRGSSDVADIGGETPEAKRAADVSTVNPGSERNGGRLGRGGVCTAVPGPRMLQQRGCSAPAPATTTSSAASSSSSSSSSFTTTTMFPQQYCLRWKYHHSNLQTMFSQLLERQAYCDVTLACEGKTLRAHKVSRAKRRGVMSRR